MDLDVSWKCTVIGRLRKPDGTYMIKQKASYLLFHEEDSLKDRRESCLLSIIIIISSRVKTAKNAYVCAWSSRSLFYGMV